jgi:PPOX class probable F420-dependent enzyme
MGGRLDISMSLEEVRDLLSRPLPAVFTTHGPDGWPHAAGMWFVLDDDDILMWTYRKSQKAVNARRDPRCAFLVERGHPYADLQGVLVRGHVRLVEDRARVISIGRRLYEQYLQARAGVAYEQGPAQEIERQAGKRIGLVLPLGRVATWDHSKMGISSERLRIKPDDPQKE